MLGWRRCELLLLEIRDFSLLLLLALEGLLLSGKVLLFFWRGKIIANTISVWNTFRRTTKIFILCKIKR